MTGPLVLLALCAILLGFLGTPYWPWLQRTLDPTFKAEAGGAGLMVLSIVLVAFGLGIGWAIYGRNVRTTATAPDPLAVRAPGLWAALGDRLGFDAFYAATVFKLNAGAAALADALDRYVWGGAIRLLTRLGEFAGVVHRETDEDVLNGGFDAASRGLRSGGETYSKAQTGDAHGYLRAVGLGFVVIVLVVMLGGGR
jgi:NADH-quinone oxidoreductase subunit L